jgi:hypothetical protein
LKTASGGHASDEDSQASIYSGLKDKEKADSKAKNNNSKAG